MAWVDRSEELYAKIAAMPTGRRAICNLIAIMPLLIFIVDFYLLSLFCYEDRKSLLATIVLITLILNCFAINGSLVWFVLSYPWLPRKFAGLSPMLRLALILCIVFTFIILKPLFGPLFVHLDNIHTQRCEGRYKMRYAGNQPAVVGR